jgi:hypothetical protein
MKLVDFMIEISDPQKFREFQQSPENVMNNAGLSHGDRLAVQSRNPGMIRYQAIHNDLDFTSAMDAASDVAIEALDIEVNHQTETEHDEVAEAFIHIKRRFGPNTTFYPEEIAV